MWYSLRLIGTPWIQITLVLGLIWSPSSVSPFPYMSAKSWLLFPYTSRLLTGKYSSSSHSSLSLLSSRRLNFGTGRVLTLTSWLGDSVSEEGSMCCLLKADSRAFDFLYLKAKWRSWRTCDRTPSVEVFVINRGQLCLKLPHRLHSPRVQRRYRQGVWLLGVHQLDYYHIAYFSLLGPVVYWSMAELVKALH